MSSTSPPSPSPPPIPRPPRGWHRVEPGPDNEIGMYFDPSRPPKDFHDDRRYHRRAEPEPPARRTIPHRKKSFDRRELERSRYISRSPSPKPRMPPRDRSPIDVDRLTRSGDFRRYHEERELSPRTITNIRDYLGLSSNRHNETSAKAPREAKPKRPASPETDIYGNPPDHKYYNPSSTLRLRERRDEEPRERKKKSASPPPTPSLPGIPHRFRRTDDHDRNDRESDDPKPKPRFEKESSQKPSTGDGSYETREDPFEFLFGKKRYVTVGPGTSIPWWWDCWPREDDR